MSDEIEAEIGMDRVGELALQWRKRAESAEREAKGLREERDEWCKAWAEAMGEARFEKVHPEGMANEIRTILAERAAQAQEIKTLQGDLEGEHHLHREAQGLFGGEKELRRLDNEAKDRLLSEQAAVIERAREIAAEFRRCVDSEKKEGDHSDENESCEDGMCYWVGDKMKELAALPAPRPRPTLWRERAAGEEDTK